MISVFLQIILLTIKQGADIGTYFIRPDSLRYEPVFVSTPVVPADVGILTTTNQSTKLKTDTTDVVYNLDAQCYIYFSIIVFLVAVALTASSTLQTMDKRRQKKRRMRKILTRFKESCWQIISLVVDQENYISNTWSIRVVWVSFNITCFVFIFGYFWNLMSAEQSVSKEPPKVDSLTELLHDPQFKDMHPVALKMFYILTLLADVPPTSEEGILHKRMVNLGNKSFVDAEFTKGPLAMLNGPLRVVLNDLIAGKVALLCMAWALEMAEVLIPHLFGEASMKGRKFHMAKQSFLQGTLNAFYSKQINPNVREYMDYR